MIILTSTDKVQAVLGGAVTANQLQCFASYRDITTSAYTAGRNVVLTNGNTAVDVVGSPASETSRVVDFLSIYNSDAVAQTVTVTLYNGSSSYTLFKSLLGAGEKLEYNEGNGFQVFTTYGSIKTSNNQGNNVTSTGLSAVVLGGDVVNNNAVANTIADVTGLSFPVSTGGTYYFKFIIKYSSASTSNGSRWSINGPTFSALNYRSIYTLTATTITTNNATAYDTPAKSSASSLATGNLAIIEGFITVTADGSIIARFASELANNAITALAGSVVYYQLIA